MTFPAANIRDWRGKSVLDPEGAKIGSLESIYVDTATDAPAFAAVTIGMIGRHRLAFVPLYGATVTPDAVRVLAGKDLVKGSPTTDTDGELTAEAEPGLFAYYALDYQLGATGARRLARR